MIDHETAESALDGMSPPSVRAVAPGSLDPDRGSPSSADPVESDRVADAAANEIDSAGETFASRPIGAYLRRQRTLRGISVEELSSLTRIPLRSLERLERGEFDGETDGFARGFVRTVAVALGLDVQDTISRMLNEPSAGAWERHQPGRRTKQWFAATVLFALAALSLLLLQAGWRVLVGSGSEGPDREVIVWRDPVRSLAEATGVEVDPAGEIDPSRGTRLEMPGASFDVPLRSDAPLRSDVPLRSDAPLRSDLPTRFGDGRAPAVADVDR